MHVLLGNLARAIDHVRIDAPQKRGELVEERTGTRFLFGIIRWMRMDQIETKAPEKELANEARTRPLAFARGFGDVARFLLGSECW